MTSPAITIGVWCLVFAIAACSSRSKFSKEMWFQSPDLRYQMVDDWLAHQGQNLTDKVDVINDLGEPYMNYLPRYPSLKPDLIYYLGPKDPKHKVLLLWLDPAGGQKHLIDAIDLNEY
jgi:hypothetical protein